MDGIIEFKDWRKIDLRVGKILEVEEIVGADKLYKLTVDVGKEIGKKTICAGIKEYYKKSDLEGMKIVVFTNLQPRKMRGIESEGMLLAAVSSNKEGKEMDCVLLSPGNAEVGWKVS